MVRDVPNQLGSRAFARGYKSIITIVRNAYAVELKFDIGRQSFWFTGHAEYIGATTNEMGDAVKGWILAQPQLGWDGGKAVTGATNQLFLGVEYQYWRNKLGVANDDNIAQLWVMWRL